MVGSTSKWKDGTPFPSSRDPLKKTGEVCFYLESFGESTYFLGGSELSSKVIDFLLNLEGITQIDLSHSDDFREVMVPGIENE